MGLLLLCICLQAHAAIGSTRVAQRMGLMPLSFTQNQGQWDEQVSFHVNAGGFVAWFSSDKIHYQFSRRIPVGTTSRSRLGDGEIGNHTDLSLGNDDSVVTMAISATFIGANPNPQIIGAGLTDYKCNYFIGDNPTKWHTDVPNFDAVIFKEIYPGIDLKYYGNGDGKLEYDFIIQPGADFSQIAIRYDGVENVCVDDAGQLIVETEWGQVTEQAPTVNQYINGERKEVRQSIISARGIFSGSN